MGSVYRSAWALLRLPSVRRLVLVLFTCRVAFSPTDAMLSPKLVEMGLPKAHLAYISTLIAPLHIVLPLVVRKRSPPRSPQRPFSLCISGIASVPSQVQEPCVGTHIVTGHYPVRARVSAGCEVDVRRRALERVPRLLPFQARSPHHSFIAPFTAVVPPSLYLEPAVCVGCRPDGC